MKEVTLFWEGCLAGKQLRYVLECKLYESGGLPKRILNLHDNLSLTDCSILGHIDLLLYLIHLLDFLRL